MPISLLQRRKAAQTALSSDAVDEVLDAVESMAPGSDLDHLADSATRALQGDRGALREYVAAYGAFTDELLGAVRDARPDFVVQHPDGTMSLVDVQGKESRAALAALKHGAATVAFSPWVASHGTKDGLALHIIACLRGVLPDNLILLPHHGGLPHWDVDDAKVESFFIGVSHELEPMASSIDSITEAFELNDTELARLFGVRRQAVAQWRAGKVPRNRLAKLTTVASLADLLSRKLRRERVPGVVRRPAAAYGGSTMLEMIAADRHDELLASVRASFDPSVTA